MKPLPILCVLRFSHHVVFGSVQAINTIWTSAYIIIRSVCIYQPSVTTEWIQLFAKLLPENIQHWSIFALTLRKHEGQNSRGQAETIFTSTMDHTHTPGRPRQRMTKKTMWRYSQESIGEKKKALKFIIHILTTAQAPTKTTEKNILAVNKISFIIYFLLEKDTFFPVMFIQFSEEGHSKWSVPRTADVAFVETARGVMHYG